jgi:SP family arabinose:H+ symporter-like MFS transporter
MTKKTLFIAFVVSLGGFLFGFDAGIISGVMSYAGPQFDLNDAQTGWVVSSPSFAAMIAMLVAGRLSDRIGRKKILIVVAFLYALSAITSAYAVSYEALYLSRMVGGLAFGAALILAPTYIAEISTAENRGKLVSIQQLNIVLGFFAAFLSNYYFNQYNVSGSEVLSDENVWRWMLGVEFFPAIFYFGPLFFVPKSPRWLYNKNRADQAKNVLERIHGSEQADIEIHSIEKNIEESEVSNEVSIRELIAPALRFIMIVGITLGILQQVTGINAIYFYATSIFKQTGIGTDAAFSSGVLLSFTTVVFTLLAIYLIDRMGRRPLLIVGMSGIALSLLLCAYSFSQATYELSASEINSFENIDTYKLAQFQDIIYDNDVSFKNDIKAAIGNQVYALNEGTILEAAINMNATLVLIGILGFIACFAFSLGPVMWVMLSEIFPNRYRGLAIGVIGFINSFSSWLIQQIFPWEISNLGSALTFLIYGLIATVGVLLFIKILPETKGKSLEQLENELVKYNA